MQPVDTEDGNAFSVPSTVTEPGSAAQPLKASTDASEPGTSSSAERVDCLDDSALPAVAEKAETNYVPVPPSQPHTVTGRPAEDQLVTATPTSYSSEIHLEGAALHQIQHQQEMRKAEDGLGQTAADSVAAEDSVFPGAGEVTGAVASHLPVDSVEASTPAKPSDEIVAVRDDFDNTSATAPRFTNADENTEVTGKQQAEAADLGALENAGEPQHVFSPLPTTESNTDLAHEAVAGEEEGVPSAAPVYDVEAFAAAPPPEHDSTSEPAATTTVTPAVAAPASAAADSQAWVVDFGTGRAKPKRKMTKKEKDAIKESRLRSQAGSAAGTINSSTSKATTNQQGMNTLAGLGADSEGNMTHTDAPLSVVQLDGLADPAAQIPLNLTTTRSDLEQRLVLRMPRLLCVNKQYPRGCGIASLTSVYNYLYSWLGESEVGAQRQPHSQEELMSILGFEPPFGEIAWGPFTGNATLIRWFHALNRHFGLRGRAYILYKAHGHGKTTHLYPDNAAALVAVKAALRDPHCALIYHCHNHYMVPVGYQEIPHAQTDFLKPSVPKENCDTTLFIGEVSRGRHEAMYARKWEQVVKDIECKSPHFFNIRHPEQGIQKREPKKKKAAAAAAAAVTAEITDGAPVAAMSDGVAPPSEGHMLPAQEVHEAASNDATAPVESQSAIKEKVAGRVEAAVETAAAAAAVDATPPPTLFIPMPASVRGAETVRNTGQLGAAAMTGSDGANEVEVSVAAPPEGVRLSEERAGSASGAVTDSEHANGAEVCVVPNEETTREAHVEASPAHGVRDAPEAVTSFPASVEGEQAQSVSDSAATAAAEAMTDAGPAEPPASPVTAAEAAPVMTATGLALTSHAALSSRVAPPAARATRPAASASASAAAAKPKKERGNLHCLIIFRNDQVEDRLDRYEEAAAEDEAAAASASSSDGSSSSDEDAG